MSYSDAGLACNMTCQYRVYAYNASGRSAYLTLDAITTPACVYHWPGENYLPLVVRR